MLIYIFYFFVLIILLFVILLAFQAINRGIKGKNNLNDKFEDNKKNEPDIIEKIKNLETMYNNGTLNEEEFKKAKTKLLGN